MLRGENFQCHFSLGSDEIQDMIQTDGQAEAQCHFCNENYHFSKEDLLLLLEAAV